LARSYARTWGPTWGGAPHLGLEPAARHGPQPKRIAGTGGGHLFRVMPGRPLQCDGGADSAREETR